MSVMYVLVPVALALVAAAIAAYLWAVRCGQLDDLETPAVRALHDDPAEARAARGRSSEAPREP